MEKITPSLEIIHQQLSLASQWHQQGKRDRAEAVYRNILNNYPNQDNALNLLGVIEYEKRNYENAAHFVELAIHNNNQNREYFNNLGAIYEAMGKLEPALVQYLAALHLKEGCPKTLNNIAVVYFRIGEIEKSLKHLNTAVESKKEYYQTYINLSAILNQQKKYSQALDYAQKGLLYSKNDYSLLNNKANALKGLGKNSQAIDTYKKSIDILPKRVEGYLNLGHLLQELGNLNEAYHYYKEALLFNPDNAEIHNNIGMVLKNIGNFSDAMMSYKTAIRFKPYDAFAYHNMGNVYMELGENDKAIKCLNKAISLAPKLIEAHISLGMVYQDQGIGERAIDCFLEAITMNPEYGKPYSHLVRSLQHECRWEELEHYNPILDKFTKKALDSQSIPDETPFLNLSRHCNPLENYRIAKAWSHQIVKQIQDERNKIQNLLIRRNRRSDKITLGYLSNNFKNHPTSHLIGDLFKYHNRDQFNIHCYSYGINDRSFYRDQIKNHCDRFVDILSLNHFEAAKVIQNDEVDILVDLVGQMKANRLEIAALKPAPIQVRWLGMAGTTGGNFFDYIITDHIVTPRSQISCFSEKFAYMPNSYHINNTQYISNEKYFRENFGLPKDKIVFANFCSTYKIDPIMYDIWIKILKQVPDSVLWLLEPSRGAKKQLQKEAAKKGIDPQRLVFSKKNDRSDHLLRIGLADLCLDTRIVNGAATSSEALLAGLPVLTLKGSHFASCMGASILSAVELPELIANTIEEYIDFAVKYATTPSFKHNIVTKVHQKRISASLFNALNHINNMEKLFKLMWSMYNTGEDVQLLEV